MGTFTEDTRSAVIAVLEVVRSLYVLQSSQLCLLPYGIFLVDGPLHSQTQHLWYRPASTYHLGAQSMVHQNPPAIDRVILTFCFATNKCYSQEVPIPYNRKNLCCRAERLHGSSKCMNILSLSNLTTCLI